jgi:hypothetical protein
MTTETTRREDLLMADLDDISPDEIPSVPDDPHPDDQPVADPQAVAHEDEDNPRPSGLDDDPQSRPAAT